MSDETKVAPAIYVASLTDYNAGRLVGKWITLPGMDEESLGDAIADILKEASLNGPDADGPYEEWAIHDYEGFGSYRLGEYEPLSKVCELAAMIADEDRGDAFLAWIAYDSENANRLDEFEDAFLGVWESELAYVTEMFDETHEIPDDLASYIDYDAIRRDWFTHGTLLSVPAPDYYVYIFETGF